MNKVSRTVFGLLTALCITTLMLWSTGCGSDDGVDAPVLIRSGSGSITGSDPELADGSHGDTYTFTAARDGMVAVSMSSANVDSFVFVWTGTAAMATESTIIGGDDDSGVGLDAVFVFEVTANSAYSFCCSTSGPDDFGDYKYAVTYLDNRAFVAYDDTDAGKPAKSVNEKLLLQ